MRIFNCTYCGKECITHNAEGSIVALSYIIDEHRDNFGCTVNTKNTLFCSD